MSEENKPTFLDNFFDESKKLAAKFVKILNKKITQEVQQFNDMGGWSNAGEYVAHNVTSLGVEGAKGVGADTLAENIEGNRSAMLAAGRAVDNKIKEEAKQFNDMGGLGHAGEYVAQNMTSLGVQVAKGVGADELAKNIEGNRSAMLAAGRAVDNKIQEEIQQFNDMGGLGHAGEYVAQNMTSLGVEGAKALGADGLARDIESKREDMLEAGRAVDAKIKEEIQQFKDMGGWSNAGEYVAQNMTSLGVQVAKGVGADALAENIEGNRSAMLAAGRAVDNKLNDVKNDVANLKAELAEQKGAPVQPTCPAQVRFALRVNQHTKLSPLYNDILQNVAHEDWQSFESSLPQLKKAEIKELITSDGQSVNVTILDGKKHGFEITRDTNGNITAMNVYDHGQKLDLFQNTIEFKSEEKDGVLLEYGTLNGQVFGTQTLIDKDGNAKVAFYEKDGKLIRNTADSQIVYTVGQSKDNNKILLSAAQQKQHQL